MTRLRKTIASRLVEVQQNAALLTTVNEADMSAVMELRSRFKQRYLDEHGIKLGFMSFFVKAVIEGLKAFPALNAEIRGDDIVYKHYFDIGVAVGGGKGLVVPILRNVAVSLMFASPTITCNRRYFSGSACGSSRVLMIGRLRVVSSPTSTSKKSAR